MKIVYEKNGEEYHGGYSLEMKNNGEYLGGNTVKIEMKSLVVPFGLFYKNQATELHKYAIDNCHKESKLIDDNIFDKLFFSVGKIEKQKYNHSKTQKNR
jgi:hypothetical protein